MTTTQPISFQFTAPPADEHMHHADRAYRAQAVVTTEHVKTTRIPVVAS